MTANLILERSQCLPLIRQDEGMAFELLMAEPVFGIEAIREVIDVGDFATVTPGSGDGCARLGCLACRCGWVGSGGYYHRVPHRARTLGLSASDRC